MRFQEMKQTTAAARAKALASGCADMTGDTRFHRSALVMCMLAVMQQGRRPKNRSFRVILRLIYERCNGWIVAKKDAAGAMYYILKNGWIERVSGTEKFALTPSGLAELDALREEWKRFVVSVDAVLEESETLA